MKEKINRKVYRELPYLKNNKISNVKTLRLNLINLINNNKAKIVIKIKISR